jgi:hypothetical protein
MKDYYKILGVNREASDEEIRARWIELMKHYHPDLGRKEKDDGRIKEINEAYHILKNPSTRMEYDLERDLRRSYVKKRARAQRGKGFYIGIASVAGLLILLLILSLIISKRAPVAVQYSGAIQHKETVKDDAPGKPKVPTSEVYPIGPPPAQEGGPKPPRRVLSGWLSKPETSEKTDLSLKIEREEAPLRVAKASPAVSRSDQITPEEFFPKPDDLKTSIPHVAVPAPKTEPPKPSVPEPAPLTKPLPDKQIEKVLPVEIPKPETVKPETGEKIAAPSGEGTKPKGKGTLPAEAQQGRKPPVTAKPKEPEKATEGRLPVPEFLPARESEFPAKVEPALPPIPRKEEARPVLPQDRPVKKEVAIAPPPRPPSQEEEVRQFFAEYVDCYARRDIEGFLGCFSAMATQNWKDGMEGIRKIYTSFFNQSQDLSYRLEEPKIEIYQNGMAVKARYEVNQILKKGGARKVWKGQGRWFLTKEEGKLRIVSLDYQHD